jgi:hypothetical protein
MEGRGRWEGEGVDLVQTMYTHMNKCKNKKIKIRGINPFCLSLVTNSVFHSILGE